MIELARKAVQKYLEAGYLRESHSNWCNPMKPVKTAGSDKARITCNYMCLNKIAEGDKYTLPRIREIIESTRNKKYFTLIDLSDGYFQIHPRDENQHKIAFLFQKKLYEWTRMPQGYKNSPAVFQETMNRILRQQIGNTCKTYLGDILVCGMMEQEHDEALKGAMEKFSDARAKLNINKIKYEQPKMNLLGAIVDGATQTPIDAMREKL